MRKLEPKKPYVYHEFPKWKYHQTKSATLTRDKSEEMGLGKDWKDSPACFGDEAHPSTESVKHPDFWNASLVPQNVVELPRKRGRPAKARE